MGLLRLHFQISALCALAIFGTFFVFWRKMVENGWAKGDGKKRGLLARFGRCLYTVCVLLITSLIPFINISAVWNFWKMATKKKECADNGDAET